MISSTPYDAPPGFFWTPLNPRARFFHGMKFKAKLFRYPGPGGWTWRDKKYGTLPPVSKAVRGDKGDGDTVTIELRVATR